MEGEVYGMYDEGPVCLWDLVDPGNTKSTGWVYIDPGVDQNPRGPDSFNTFSSTSSGWSSVYQLKRKNCSLSSSSVVSVTSRESMFSIPNNVALELWHENPEQDVFNTFAVSEPDLTHVIQYLEGQLQDKLLFSSVQSEIINNVKVSPKVTFILDTFCHMYMTR